MQFPPPPPPAQRAAGLPFFGSRFFRSTTVVVLVNTQWSFSLHPRVYLHPRSRCPQSIPPSPIKLMKSPVWRVALVCLLLARAVTLAASAGRDDEDGDGVLDTTFVQSFACQ